MNKIQGFIVSLFRNVFSNSFNDRNRSEINDDNAENVENSISKPTHKRVRDENVTELINPKKRKLTVDDFVTGRPAIGSSTFKCGSRSISSKPFAFIDLTGSDQNKITNNVYCIEDDEHVSEISQRPVFELVNNYNVLKEVNSSRFNLKQPKVLLSRSGTLGDQCSRSAFLLNQVFKDKGCATYIEMLKKNAGASAHRKSLISKKSPAVKSLSKNQNDATVMGTSVGKGYFTRKLMPSAPVKNLLDTTDTLFNRTVIDLTYDEEDDVSQRQVIESKIRRSARIRNFKCSFLVKDSPVADPNYLKKMVESYKQKRQDDETATERLKKGMRKEKEELNKTLAQILDKKLSLKEVHEEEPKPSFEIAPITKQMIETINNIIRSRKNPLVQIKDTGVKIQDIRTLDDGVWLNDEIINAYMNLIKLRAEIHPEKYPMVHCFNTFLYEQLLKKGYASVRRWTKRVDIFDFAIIIVPIHLRNHWCLIEIRVTEKMILYYDSLGSPNNRCLETILQYLVDEHHDKKNQLLDSSEWKLSNILPDEIPRQKNAYDCGVFACTYAEHVTRNSPFNFGQQDMPYFRIKMSYEILTGGLLL